MHPAELRERLRTLLDPDPEPRVVAGDRVAGVLVPVVEVPQLALVFTRRTDDLPRHAGEISFPGGLRQDEDFGLRETALRETKEELGLDPATVDVLGALSPVHTTVSAIVVVPFVGMLGAGPAFSPNVSEIAAVLEYRIDALASAEAEVEWPIGDHVYRGFAYEMPGNTIWGATARILHELIDLVRKETPWLLPS